MKQSDRAYLQPKGSLQEAYSIIAFGMRYYRISHMKVSAKEPQIHRDWQGLYTAAMEPDQLQAH